MQSMSVQNVIILKLMNQNGKAEVLNVLNASQKLIVELPAVQPGIFFLGIARLEIDDTI